MNANHFKKETLEQALNITSYFYAQRLVDRVIAYSNFFSFSATEAQARCYLRYLAHYVLTSATIQNLCFSTLNQGRIQSVCLGG